MTTHLHYAAITYVFRLLGRGRASAQRLSGSALGEALTTLREEGQSALIEVELPNGSLGRLLVQVGRPVFVQCENRVAEEALGELEAGAAQARLYLLKLSDEQIILACAALKGIPLALGEPLPAGTESLSALLTQLGRQSFTGVVALEQGLQTLIWRFQRGRLLNSLELPGKVRAGRLTQLVWQEQLLPEVGAAKTHVTTAHAGSVVPEPVRAPVQAAVPLIAPPKQAHLHAAQMTAPQVTASPTATPRAAGFDTAPQTTGLQTTGLQTTAPQTVIPQTTAPEARFSSVSGQQSSRKQNSSEQAFREPTFREPRRKTCLEPDTEEVWARFQEVLSAQLGNRGERTFQLMQGELGGFRGAELIGRLTLQVERMAGSAAARNFRDSF